MEGEAVAGTVLMTIIAVVKHLLKRDTFTTRRTKEVIEGDEQIFFKNKNVIAVWDQP